jgi:CRISPR type IV-associated protein Csf3
MNYRVSFHLDGSGVGYDPAEPLHLDALLAWALAPRIGVRPCLSRDDPVDLVPLPLEHSIINGAWVWHASALVPVGPTGEDLTFWRKRFRQGRAEITQGSPNLTNGTYRDWNMPLPLALITRLDAYAGGSRKEAKRLLREVRGLGRKRAHGHGKVLRLELVEVNEDWSHVREGLAMRWLPTPGAARMVRFQPPYWHPAGRVACCEVGDVWPPRPTEDA